LARSVHEVLGNIERALGELQAIFESLLPHDARRTRVQRRRRVARRRGSQRISGREAATGPARASERPLIPAAAVPFEASGAHEPAVEETTPSEQPQPVAAAVRSEGEAIIRPMRARPRLQRSPRPSRAEVLERQRLIFSRAGKARHAETSIQVW
jgi:hypothetical protein